MIVVKMVAVIIIVVVVVVDYVDIAVVAAVAIVVVGQWRQGGPSPALPPRSAMASVDQV